MTDLSMKFPRILCIWASRYSISFFFFSSSTSWLLYSDLTCCIFHSKMSGRLYVLSGFLGHPAFVQLCSVIEVTPRASVVNFLSQRNGGRRRGSFSSLRSAMCAPYPGKVAVLFQDDRYNVRVRVSLDPVLREELNPDPVYPVLVFPRRVPCCLCYRLRPPRPARESFLFRHLFLLP